MTLIPSRVTLTTTPHLIAENPGGLVGTDEQSRRVELIFQASSGTVYIGGSSSGDNAASSSRGARLDIAIFAAWSTVLEPGEELWMTAATGTIGVDVIVGGR